MNLASGRYDVFFEVENFPSVTAVAGLDTFLIIFFPAFKQCKIKVTNLRMKGSMTGDGCNMKLDRLYYLSVHTLDGQDGVRYAKNRVARELTDLWVDKKISFGGITFDDSADALTEEDFRHKCEDLFLCQ